MGYWDLEEGKDCVTKTWITTKVATAIGLVGSAYHIVAYPPETAVEALTRATSGTASMAAMGAIFGMATCLSAQARDAPDDPTNYFIGGCASGIFLGARSKYNNHTVFNIIQGHLVSFFFFFFLKEQVKEVCWCFCYV
uniref:NADH dehydrogenase [ubiquinone] 1 alpha subcomplex subunit 11 n=1 Tax=Cyprinus carpio carpio TaxID=630221 RepID=A0A9J7ZKB6_CYPCA